MARAWAHSLDERRQVSAVWQFMTRALSVYSEHLGLPAPPAPGYLAERVIPFPLDFSAANLAMMTGRAAAELDPVTASYWLSVTYTAMLPDALRTQLGIYYTPPALSARLLEMATEAGTDWKTCTVLDPACGGGAFLGPVALRMAAALGGESPSDIVKSIAKRLRGFEIDAFAAWLSQTFLEIALTGYLGAPELQLPPVVTVCNSLEMDPHAEGFDLVIGNPPYGQRFRNR
jgi:adenine-specific DNA-methyltransferase